MLQGAGPTVGPLAHGAMSPWCSMVMEDSDQCRMASAEPFLVTGPAWGCSQCRPAEYQGPSCSSPMPRDPGAEDV